MDPASAIGVAAATVQFFAIGIKAIRLGKQVCASKTGSTEANEALAISLRAISDIRKDLRHCNSRCGLEHRENSETVPGNCRKALESSREHQSIFSDCQVQVFEGSFGNMAGHESSK